MTKLLSHNLWTELSTLAGNHNHLAAAVAYVTTQHLAFKAGDVLICDASDRRIRDGSTSAKTLEALARAGVELYSVADLHAKCFVVDGAAAIGSANMSERAGHDSVEAMLLTRDVQIVSLVTGFISQLQDQADKIDEQFLNRALSIRVESSAPGTGRPKVSVASMTSRVWFLSTTPLSDREEESLDASEQVAAALQEAEARKKTKEREIARILYSGNSKFMRDASPGDIVIECRADSAKPNTSFRVFKPMTLLHSVPHERQRLFLLEDTDPDDEHGLDWEEFAALIAQLHVSAPKPTSTKELTGKAAKIVQLMS